MALTINNDSNVNTYTILKETASGVTANTNVTGTSGRIYSVDISVASGGSYVSYLKFKLTSGTATVGTTEPDLMLNCLQNTSERYDFPSGLPFEQLTFWTSRNPATSDTTAPNTTIVTILTGP